MSSVKMQGGASGTGSVTLLAPNTNNTDVLTLPDAASDTLAALAATQTLTNKTLGSGTVLTTTPPVTTAQSMIRANTAGRASTNTAVLYWTTVVVNQGSDITYTQSTTSGDSFTINTSGVYAFSGSAFFGSSNNFALTLNGSQLTTNVTSLTQSTVLASTTNSANGNSIGLNWTGYLASGSVVRFQTETTASISATTPSVVTAVRIS